MGDWLDDCEMGDTTPPKGEPEKRIPFSVQESVAIAQYDDVWLVAKRMRSASRFIGENLSYD